MRTTVKSPNPARSRRSGEHSSFPHFSFTRTPHSLAQQSSPRLRQAGRSGPMVLSGATCRNRIPRSSPRNRLVSLLLIGVSGIGCLGLAVLFGNCGIILLPAAVAAKPVAMASEGISESIEHAKGPIPEAVWNSDGLWYRSDDHPPTYLPKGYSRERSLGPSAGSWMVDERDGKRLFIPKGGVGDIPEGTFRSVARYATRWQPRDKEMGSPMSEITLERLIMGQ